MLSYLSNKGKLLKIPMVLPLKIGPTTAFFLSMDEVLKLLIQFLVLSKETPIVTTEYPATSDGVKSGKNNI